MKKLLLNLILTTTLLFAVNSFSIAKQENKVSYSISVTHLENGDFVIECIYTYFDEKGEKEVMLSSNSDNHELNEELKTFFKEMKKEKKEELKNHKKELKQIREENKKEREHILKTKNKDDKAKRESLKHLEVKTLKEKKSLRLKYKNLRNARLEKQRTFLLELIKKYKSDAL